MLQRSSEKNTSVSQEENILIRQAIAGRQQAQYTIYQKYVAAMFHTVIRMVGNREDAEDVTQEAFTKVFQRLDTYRGEATLGAWIKRVTVNAALNFLRKKKKLYFEELNDRTVVADLPEIDEAEWAFNMRSIHEAIKQLPDGCRMVFNLYMMEGYKHAEVANMLGITESTSKTQFRRAKRLVREIVFK